MKAELSIACSTCKAPKGSPCVSTGRIVPKGSTMGAFHAARTSAAPDVRDAIAEAIRVWGGGLRGEEIAASTDLPEEMVWRVLGQERKAGRLVDLGDRGWFLAGHDPLVLARALERYARAYHRIGHGSFDDACRAADLYRCATGDYRYGSGFVVNASPDELLEAIRDLRGAVSSVSKRIDTGRTVVAFQFQGAR